MWGHNGRELFFIGGTPVGLHVATYRVDPTFQVGGRRRLFDLQGSYFLSTPNWRSFDVAHDGERFLMIRVPVTASTDATPFIYILNFFEELKARVGN